MIRLAVAGFMTVTLLVVSAGAADDPKPDEPEPPVRLKKKDKPNDPAPEKKPDAPKEGPKEKPKEDPKQKNKPKPSEPDESEPEVDEKETLARINKNMRASEDRLAKKDASESTRQIQRDILKDIDTLFEQKKKQQQQQSSQQNQNPQDQQSKQNQRSQRSQRNQQANKRSGSDQRPGQGNQPRDAGNQAGAGSSGSKKDGNKLADLYKDVWGHLPEMMRMEMDTYSKEKFMARYKELLEQYYATIAEKGRRKGD